MKTPALRAPSQPFPFRVAFLLVLAFGTVTSVASAPLAHAATVRTDYLDYSPGDEVLVTGTGWLPNETVSLYFDETPYQYVPITLYTVADAEGNISNHDYVIQDYHLGTAFVLTATGITSGITAQTLFTDSPKVGPVSVSGASGAPCAGTSAPTTFTVTVFRGNGGGSAGAFTADLTVPSGLPSGTSASFSPNPVSFTPGAASRTATLTLTTSVGTPSGTSTFRVKAGTSASDTASTTATFTVNQPPSITSPGNLTASNEPGQCGATVSFAATATGSPVPTITYSKNPGTVFPVGVTTVTATATNACGSVNTTFTVTVNDTEKPSIATSNLTRPTDPGVCGATVALGTTASDNCSVASLTGVRSDAAPLGAVFPVGTTTVTWTALDPAGNSKTATQTVTVNDTEKPTLAAPANLTITTGADATQCGATADDTALGTATATDNCSATVTRSGVPSDNLFPVGTTTLTYTATDASGNTASATQTITIVDNTPPSITTADLSVATDAGVCGATVTLGTTATDNCSVSSLVGTRSDGAAIDALFLLGTTTITWVATDAAGNTMNATQTITVANPTPTVVIASPASGALYAAGGTITMSGTFTDNAGDLHTARWVCDALTIPATVNEATGAVGGTLCLTAPGVYKVTLEVTDQCANMGSASQVGGLQAMIVVYDPSAGFVTGGGWIQSPAGSYATNPALVGKANFGFVSKYKKGQSTPTGETEFQFKAGDLNFHSTSYDWLVVSGAKAQFKGSGTINGAGSFGFMITATDGQTSGGGGMDKFRIKITDKATSLTVYDNQMGASDDATPATALGGGTIAIHSSSGFLSAALMGPGSLGAETAAPAATALFQNSPNPFNPATTIRFALREAGRVTVQVYGVHGELVRTVVDAWLPAGTHTATWNGATRSGGRAASGVYYAVLQSGGFRDKVQMVMVK
jgi:hypothetical protein